METIILKNIAELITCQGNAPKHGQNMNDAGKSSFDCVVLRNGKIKEIGNTADILTAYRSGVNKQIDCVNNAVLPGFIDSHTHFIFAGHRQDEFNKRLQGKSYMEIMAEGGGIANTVVPTRNASLDKLVKLGKRRANTMLKYGVTTVEGKSGYGLDKDAELKQLQAMQRINQEHPIDIAPTFMGAHLVPKEYKGDTEGYLNYLLEEVLPIVKQENLAEFVDIFCEEGVFEIEESRQYLQKAKDMGFDVKLHADEIVDMGGASLGAKLGAVSADHLLAISKEGIADMASSNTIATLLPATAFSLKKPFAPARDMIDNGCAVALATDFNPGSSCTCSIPLLIALSALNMEMTTNEIVTALTINAACAINRQDNVGSIEIGKQADIIILEYPSIDYLPYYMGMNIVKTVIKNGEVV